jgi:hypothetical protein
MMEPRQDPFDFPCSLTWRSYYSEDDEPLSSLGESEEERLRRELWERVEKRCKAMTSDQHWQQIQPKPAPVIYRPKSKGVEI